MPSSAKERIITSEIISKYETLDNITELGSGWGGLTRYIALTNPTKAITGVEISIIPYISSKILSTFHPSNNISYKYMNFNNITLESNTIYVAYLSNPVMKKLRKQFEKHMPSNSILISIAFAMPGWTPVKITQVDSIIHSPIYIYEL